MEACGIPSAGVWRHRCGRGGGTVSRSAGRPASPGCRMCKLPDPQAPQAACRAGQSLKGDHKIEWPCRVGCAALHYPIDHHEASVGWLGKDLRLDSLVPSKSAVLAGDRSEATPPSRDVCHGPCCAPPPVLSIILQPRLVPTAPPGPPTPTPRSRRCLRLQAFPAPRPRLQSRQLSPAAGLAGEKLAGRCPERPQPDACPGAGGPACTPAQHEQTAAPTWAAHDRVPERPGPPSGACTQQCTAQLRGALPLPAPAPAGPPAPPPRRPTRHEHV